MPGGVEAGIKAGELVFNLLFNADSMKLAEFTRSLGDLNMKSILTGTELGTVIEATKFLINTADLSALSINKFGRETGQSTLELQKWSKVAEQMGVNAGTVASGVKRLQQNIFFLNKTGEGSEIWNLLSMDPTKNKNMFDLLFNLGKRLKGMDVVTQSFYLNAIGLTDEWLNILPQIVDNYDQLEKNVNMSNEDLKVMNHYHQENVRLGQDLNGIWNKLGAVISPIWTSFAGMASSVIETVENSWVLLGIFNTIKEVTVDIYKIWKFMVEAMKEFSKMPLAKAIFPSLGLFDLGSNLGSLGNTILDTTGPTLTKIFAPINVSGPDPQANAEAVKRAIDRVHSDAANMAGEHL